jgi:hypothetical protein
MFTELLGLDEQRAAPGPLLVCIGNGKALKSASNTLQGK